MTDPNAEGDPNAQGDPNPQGDPNAEGDPNAQPTPDGERSWFGDDPPANAGETDPGGLPDDGRALPDWVPGEYHDPARRGELLEALGFKAEDVQAENKPEWLPEKFNSPEELAQSYKELEKKLGSRDQPPEQYDLTLPEGVEELSDADAEAFREMGLSNEGAQKVVDYFHENVVPQMREQQTALEQQQLASSWGMVGEDGKVDNEAMKARLASVKQWADKNVPEGVVKELSRSAGGVQQLYDLMQSKGKAAPAASQPSPMDKDALQQKVNDPRYWTDEAYRNQVNREAQQAFDR